MVVLVSNQVLGLYPTINKLKCFGFGFGFYLDPLKEMHFT